MERDGFAGPASEQLEFHPKQASDRRHNPLFADPPKTKTERIFCEAQARVDAILSRPAWLSRSEEERLKAEMALLLPMTARLFEEASSHRQAPNATVLAIAKQTQVLQAQ